MTGQYFIERRFSRGFGARSDKQMAVAAVGAGADH
jgi:hypothetical protein